MCSTIVAETIALMDGCDAAFYVSQMIQETFQMKCELESITDNQSLYNNTVNTSHLVNGKGELNYPQSDNLLPIMK